MELAVPGDAAAVAAGAPQKKTARPVSRSRRFARTFSERSSHSPRGAAGHNPLQGREWPEDCGIPARYRHSRGASAPCAWNVRIGPRTGFPSHSPLERRCGALSKTTSARHSRGPSAALATARNLAVPLLRPVPAHHRPRTSCRQHSASAPCSASVGIAGRWWIGGITRMVLPALL